MPQHQPADVRPARSGLGGNGSQARFHLSRVGLIFEFGDTGTAFGVIAHGAAEHHDCAAIGPGHPVRGLVHRKRIGGERDGNVRVAGQSGARRLRGRRHDPMLRRARLDA